MNTVWKSVLAGAAALAIIGPSVAFAEQQQSSQPGTEARQHWRPSEQDFSAFTDARIAALKSGLKLTPEQEKNWPAVEQAIRDIAKARHEHWAERRNERRSSDMIERLRGRADAMNETAASLKRLADAAEPLYKSLTEDQKHRLVYLVRSMRGPRMAMHRHDHRGFGRD